MGTNAGLYDTDFYAWVQDQAALLAARRFEELDLPHLVEELQLMGNSERGELANRLSVLLAHLLKLQVAAERLPYVYDRARYALRFETRYEVSALVTLIIGADARRDRYRTSVVSPSEGVAPRSGDTTAALAGVQLGYVGRRGGSVAGLDYEGLILSIGAGVRAIPVPFARAVGRIDVAAGLAPRRTFDVSFSGQQFF